MSFIPGEFVEALQDDTPFAGVTLSKGALYCVEAIKAEIWKTATCEHGPDCRGDGVRLLSPALPRAELWWCSTQFKPIYKPRRELFAELLQPTDRPDERPTKIIEPGVVWEFVDG